MRIAFNSYISQVQYKRAKQSVNPNFGQKIQSQRIFELEKEIMPVFHNQEKYLAKLKEFSNIDINTKNSDGDSLIMKLVKEGKSFFDTILWMEKRGEIQGIDWNTTDRCGDNLLMAAEKGGDCGWERMCNNTTIIELANKGKIDANYINRKSGYSLMECILKYSNINTTRCFEINHLDVNQLAYRKAPSDVVKSVIDKAPLPQALRRLLFHPKMDLKNCNLREIFQYIDDAPWNRNYDDDYYYGYGRKGLNKYERNDYKEAIETAVKVHNAYKTKDYYEQNGMLTLDQISKHVDNTDAESAINMKLNSIGETIGHFLAETYIDPNDNHAIDKVNDIIQKLRKNTFYFWQRDDIGRTPPMLALEYENFVVARAMLKSMYDDEFKRFENRGCWQCCQLRGELDQEPDYRKIISELEPVRKEEFDKLLTERIKTSMHY